MLFFKILLVGFVTSCRFRFYYGEICGIDGVQYCWLLRYSLLRQIARHVCRVAVVHFLSTSRLESQYDKADNTLLGNRRALLSYQAVLLLPRLLNQ